MLSAVERGWNCLLVYLWEAAAILGGENMEKMKSFLRPSPEDAGAVLLLQPAELATGEPNSDQQGGIAWLIGSDRNLGRKQPHTKDNYKKKRRGGGSCDHGGREWSNVKLEKAKNGLSILPQKYSPANVLILDFWPHNHKIINFCCFKPSVCG
nr:uncharacterized protein LOC105734687 isoform X2 [Aotus nancymaae]